MNTNSAKYLVFFLYCLTFSFSTKLNAFDFDFFKSQNSRKYIYIVGSSTISPLMASVSEEFARTKNLNNKSFFPTPLVESTGTSEGFRIFCQGLSLKYPDFVNASRLMNENEIYECRKNGVLNIAKIKIGFDGIIIGNHIKNKQIKLTKEQIFLALARKIIDNKTHKLISNPYKKWSEIDKSLPDTEILVYGPPKTSGTRDLFEDLLMKDVCKNNLKLIQSYHDEKTFRNECHVIREDGKYIESGENDNLVVKALKYNGEALGIFGFNFLVANKNSIQPVAIDKISPTFESISSKQYAISRPLFVYFKLDSLSKNLEIKDFIKEIISPQTIGKNGYLVHSGLVSLSDKELKEVISEINFLIEKNN